VAKSKLEFAASYIHLQGTRISFQDRPYLDAIYNSSGRNLVIRASRQTEKSTFIVNSLLYELVTRPNVQALLVTPRWDQASALVRGRLIPALQQSPLVRRALLGRSNKALQARYMQFRNNSQLHIRAAFRSGDAVRGLSADLLFVDEMQDIAPGDLPVLMECLSHSKLGRTILTGTPKSFENALQSAYSASTANEWTIRCPGCEKDVILDEYCLGPHGVVCRHCQSAVDVKTGRWVARNPDSTWGDGFWLNHCMVPWVSFDDVLDRQRTYDLSKFKNEVLGLSTTLGEHVVTRAELEACCDTWGMAESCDDFPGGSHANMVAGIDWGGGSKSRTVVALGWMRPDFVFEVRKLVRFRADEDTGHLLECVAKLLRDFRIRFIAADGGGVGHHLNRLLSDRLNLPYGLYAILYSMTDQEPKRDGLLVKWTVNRTASIGALFSRVKKGTIRFPKVDESGTFLDELAVETAVYDDINRTIRYTHPENVQDDALHAVGYSVLLGIRQFYMRPHEHELE
jgi:hypothetical protein